VQAAQRDAQGRYTLMRDLRQAYAACNIATHSLRSADEIREQSRSMFDILTYLMLAMTTLAAAVGSIGLMGTMSINAVERRREIGVMRAIGATPPAVAGIFIAEAITLGLLSWLFAVPLSYPAARAVTDAVGYQLMGGPLDFRYSTSGAVMWLAVVIVLSTLASVWPALQATKVSVREALAYE
jgi:putative ABC transport system permease protein